MGRAVTNGGATGTGGGNTGTRAVIPWRLYLGLVAFSVTVTTINISSILIEDPPGDRDFQLWEPFTWEISSAIGFCLLLPGLYWMYKRLHWSRLPISAFLSAQVATAIIYSLLHVAVMVALRHLIYDVMNGHYDFSRGKLVLRLIYEGRKDALTCGLMLAVFWAADRLRMQSRPELPARLEVKSDGRVFYLTPAEITHAEAAGNYVELHLANARSLLLRGTLADYEKRLAPHGLVRIHRSRLLNPAHMQSFTATSSGDLRITLADGREVAASRRYRDNLDSPKSS